MKKILKFMAIAFVIILLSACRSKDSRQEAHYIGVKDYGTESVTKENLDQFIYQFENDGETVDTTVSNEQRDLLDVLKRNHNYLVEIEDGKLLSAELVQEDSIETKEPVIYGNAGEKTLLNLLKTATMPMGQALYVYGGGWNFEDTGSSIEATTIGISQDWYQFFSSQDANYNYQVEDPTES